MLSIENYNFKDKKVIIRVDFNVPLNAKLEVTDDTRIRAAIPTIKKVVENGGSVILMSHLGRPKAGAEDKFSLKHIIPTLEGRLGMTIDFADDCMGEQAVDKCAALQPGQVLLLENLRFYAEEDGKPRGLAKDASAEEKAEAKKLVKASQKEFVKKLASYASCYINDAFGTAHRAHSSTALIAEYFPNDKMFGYVINGELKAVDALMKEPQRPFVAIIGGAKVSSKITIIEKLMERVDSLIIGGAMTYTFIAAEGGKIGNSLCEPEQFDVARSVLAKAKEKGIEILFAEDTIAADSFSENANSVTCLSNEIPDGWQGLDVGPKADASFRNHILACKTILWNGPVGVFEMEKFETGSKSIAIAIADSTSNGAFSLIGGGDSVACVNKFGLADKVSYVSTGGGALLEYMEGIELPGIAAIRK